ncbi:hypothetical protein L596_000604 [Steinernema carpocapsae]|uniref:Uncharacterized protein n=1 Tax=Steinernema carpocapsae TaxID=34508 RepID=A0A4V6I759_STECR|nr:hypothetical protein L596_000604 [Steinernema carpocapsae]
MSAKDGFWSNGKQIKTTERSRICRLPQNKGKIRSMRTQLINSVRSLESHQKPFWVCFHASILTTLELNLLEQGATTRFSKKRVLV